MNTFFTWAAKSAPHCQTASPYGIGVKLSEGIAYGHPRKAVTRILEPSGNIKIVLSDFFLPGCALYEYETEGSNSS